MTQNNAGLFCFTKGMFVYRIFTLEPPIARTKPRGIDSQATLHSQTTNLHSIFHCAAGLAVQACGESDLRVEEQSSLFQSRFGKTGNSLREKSNLRLVSRGGCQKRSLVSVVVIQLL